MVKSLNPEEFFTSHMGKRVYGFYNLNFFYRIIYFFEYIAIKC